MRETSLKSLESAQPHTTAATVPWQRTGDRAEVAQERAAARDRHSVRRQQAGDLAEVAQGAPQHATAANVL